MFPTLLAVTLLLAATHSSALPIPVPAPSVRPASLVRPAAHLFTADSADPTADEREFIDRINAERTERGLYALTPDPTLTLAARGHSCDMCDQGYFSHVAAGGRRTPLDRYLAALHAARQGTPGYLLVGENIYYCSLSRPGRDVLMGHQALMNSPGHRANILDPRFSRVGVGLSRDASGQFWVTEMFLRAAGD